MPWGGGGGVVRGHAPPDIFEMKDVFPAWAFWL